MIELVKDLLGMGIRIARVTKREADKEIRQLVKARLISRKEGEQLLKAVLKEAQAEHKRVLKFVKQEARREIRKARPVLRKLARRR